MCKRPWRGRGARDATQLRVDRTTVNKTGTPDWGNVINGAPPGPVLRWQEGNDVTINPTDNLPKLIGFHWHGVILPNSMDGVPGLEIPGIRPGGTFTYRFPVVQSGAYWYHSHIAYQEQKGAYGALVIDPAGEPLAKDERDQVVLLSDWMDGSPLVVQNNLKHMSDYYNFDRRTLGTFVSDLKQSGLATTLKERACWADMRMDPSGIMQPTGALYTYPDERRDRRRQLDRAVPARRAGPAALRQRIGHDLLRHQHPRADHCWISRPGADGPCDPGRNPGPFSNSWGRAAELS